MDRRRSSTTDFQLHTSNKKIDLT